MAGTIARGREAIHADQEAAKAGGGSFRPFLPQIFWKDDREERYLLFLTDIGDRDNGAPRFEMIRYIPRDAGNNKKFFEETVSKTDKFFEEKTDAFVEEWKGRTQTTYVAIAVELEPLLFAGRGGKPKPNGFEVKTTEYVRKLVDEKVELTGEEEDVIAPCVGVVVGSPLTLFNQLEHFDAKESPITETAIKVTRLGKDQNTTYTIQGYSDQEIDLSNLIEYVEGIGYLRKEIDEVLDAIDGKSNEDAALIIGDQLLANKVDELTDEDRYQELLEGMTEPFRQFGGSGKRPSKSSRSRERNEADADAPEEQEPRRRPRSTRAEKDDAKPKRRNRETAEGAMNRIRERAEAA